MECFKKIFNGGKTLNIFAKHSMLDVWRDFINLLIHLVVKILKKKIAAFAFEYDLWQNDPNSFYQMYSLSSKGLFT